MILSYMRQHTRFQYLSHKQEAKAQVSPVRIDANSHKSLCFLHTQSMKVEKNTDCKLDFLHRSMCENGCNRWLTRICHKYQNLKCWSIPCYSVIWNFDSFMS